LSSVEEKRVGALDTIDEFNYASLLPLEFDGSLNDGQSANGQGDAEQALCQAALVRRKDSRATAAGSMRGT
jgi:hypothetical protein